MRTCRKSEWGYWYNDSVHGSSLTLLCSAECSRKYADMMFMRDVMSVFNSKTGQAIRMIDMEGWSMHAAIRAVGVNSDACVYAMRNVRWKELEWLNAHNWEVPA